LGEGLEREGIVKEDKGDTSYQEEKHLTTGNLKWVGFDFGINDKGRQKDQRY
jgi:hypothetical protein